MGVRFSRVPYTVTYYKDGEKHSIRRQPPPKLHEMLPEGEVRLTRSKNADFQAGDEMTIKGINPRQPNVLQLVNEDGLSTFVDSFDAQLEVMHAPRNGVEVIDLPVNNKYLLWP